MEAICKNCEATLVQTYNYCPSCSQKAALHRLSLYDVFHEAVHYFTHADKGIFQLLKALALDTGTVAKEFVEGRRKKYFPPLNFFLLVATVYVLAINLDGSPQAQTIKEAPELNLIKDPVKRAKATELYSRRDTAVSFIQKHSNFVSMVTLPLSAFFFWLFYRKGKYNYTEHMIAGMYMYGFMTFVFIVLILANLLIKLPVMSIYAAFFVLQITYFARFYCTFMNDFRAAKAVKAVFASFISVLSLFLASGTIVFLYMIKVF